MDTKERSLRELATAAGFRVLAGRLMLERGVSAAFASDLMSDVLAHAMPGVLLVTGLATVQTVVTANVADAAGVLYVGGKMPEPAALKLAEEEGMPLLGTELDTYGVCCLLGELGVANGAQRERGKGW